MLSIISGFTQLSSACVELVDLFLRLGIWIIITIKTSSFRILQRFDLLQMLKHDQQTCVYCCCQLVTQNDIFVHSHLYPRTTMLLTSTLQPECMGPDSKLPFLHASSSSCCQFTVHKDSSSHESLSHCSFNSDNVYSLNHTSDPSYLLIITVVINF